MRAVNIILVFDKNSENILMCLRKKPPYAGLYNLVGGKVKDGENHLSAAYRELYEETAITCDDIELYHYMDFLYYEDNILLEVYYGILNCDITPHGEENELAWFSKNEDFFDMQKYAGQGNLGHIISKILQKS